MKKGFTLAEVLITLAIIGIVAALTIPSLVKNIRNNQLKVQFEKAYAEMSQAVNMMQKDYGDLNTGTYYGPETITSQELLPFMRQYFKCASIPKSTLFKANPCGTGKESYQNFNKTTCPYVNLVGGNMIVCQTRNGMLLFARGWNNRGITMSVDTNGWGKGPNRWGYDLFSFAITSRNSRLVTAGGKSPTSAISYYPCTASTGSEERYNGAGCSYYALINQDPDNPAQGYWDNLK